MTAIQEHSFNPETDRYEFDFNKCSYSNGWFQVDTYQDAGYFGIWTNPTTREIVTYAEGDITRVVCDDDNSYAIELRTTASYYVSTYHEYWTSAKIDLGISNRFQSSQRFAELGCAAYTH